MIITFPICESEICFPLVSQQSFIEFHVLQQVSECCRLRDSVSGAWTRGLDFRLKNYIMLLQTKLLQFKTFEFLWRQLPLTQQIVISLLTERLLYPQNRFPGCNIWSWRHLLHPLSSHPAPITDHSITTIFHQQKLFQTQKIIIFYHCAVTQVLLSVNSFNDMILMIEKNE